MRRLIEGIDIDAISRRVAEHIAIISKKHRQAEIVSAISNLNLHITCLASCNSVVAGIARLEAEKDRKALIARLVDVPNTPAHEPRKETNDNA